MVYDNLKVKEHLFLIFLLGGLSALIDAGRIGVGDFVSGGIGMIFLGMGIGYFASYVQRKVTNYNQSIKNSKMIDSKFYVKKEAVNDGMKYKLRPYKYGLYVAIFFLSLVLFHTVLGFL